MHFYYNYFNNALRYFHLGRISWLSATFLCFYGTCSHLHFSIRLLYSNYWFVYSLFSNQSEILEIRKPALFASTPTMSWQDRRLV